MDTRRRRAEGPLRRGPGAPCCFVVPPDVVAHIADTGDAEARSAAIRTIGASAALRARRSIVTDVVHQLNVGLADLAFLVPPTGESRIVYDAQHQGSSGLPGARARGEGDPPAGDTAVNEAFDGADATLHFYRDVFQRQSIDDKGIQLVSSVHYGQDFDNALWNGAQMIYGDGSGHLIAPGTLTRAIEVTGHELTHGITQLTAGLQYRKQSGALNESFSDVFGSLVKQHQLGQTADQADWLIGAGILGSAIHGTALRSLKAPGTAFDMDRQPGTMSGYVDLPDDNDPRNDNGGVHVNSGIPNRVFYLVATAIGGHAWEKAGKVWYVTLTQHMKPDSDFAAAANATIQVAGDLFGAGGDEQKAVRDAWQQVGVLGTDGGKGGVAPAPPASSTPAPAPANASTGTAPKASPATAGASSPPA